MVQILNSNNETDILNALDGIVNAIGGSGTANPAALEMTEGYTGAVMSVAAGTYSIFIELVDGDIIINGAPNVGSFTLSSQDCDDSFQRGGLEEREAMTIDATDGTCNIIVERRN